MSFPLFDFCVQDDRVNQMRQYMPVKKPIYMREFPISWRDIDKGIEEPNRGGSDQKKH